MTIQLRGLLLFSDATIIVQISLRDVGKKEIIIVVSSCHVYSLVLSMLIWGIFLAKHEPILASNTNN